ncbi:hypothetical protein ABXS75_15605 [Roseburia hominis]
MLIKMVQCMNWILTTVLIKMRMGKYIMYLMMAQVTRAKREANLAVMLI